jgi:hypothetical protein
MPTFDDHQMGWKLRTLYIDYMQMGLQATATPDLLSLGVGGQVAECSTFSLLGLAMASSDTVAFLTPIPWDMDVTKDVQARLFYYHTGGSADAAIDWTFTYKLISEGVLLADPATTVDGTITYAAETAGVQYSLNITPYLTMAWTTYYAAGDVAIAGAVTLSDEGDTTSDELLLHGVEFRYTVAALDVERRVTSR